MGGRTRRAARANPEVVMSNFIHAKAGKFALSVATALLVNACIDSTGPADTDPAAGKAQLKVLAAKVRYLNPPSAQKAQGKNPTGGGFEKASSQLTAGQRGAVARVGAACDQEGESIEAGTDSTAYGSAETFEDTTRSYTAAGSLLCGLEDIAAYTEMGHHAKDGEVESWTETHVDFPSDPAASDWILKLSGNGKAAYASGYTLTMESVRLTLGYSGVTEFKMDLGLEGGYTAHLELAPGAGMDTGTPPTSSDVVLSGPILQGGTRVGTFELRGDDSVVIRDADGAAVPAPG